MTLPPRKKRHTVSSDTVAEKHPLNVKPSGNALLFTNRELSKQRNASMGYFHVLPDDLVLDIMGLLDPIDLMNLAHTSRVMYAFGFDENLWRNLYMRLAKNDENEYPLGIKNWLGSWRDTLLGIKENQANNFSLPNGLICSDLLFRPFQCSNVNYFKLFSELINEEQLSYEKEQTINKKYGIERIKESSLTQELFDNEYYLRPFIISKSSDERWPSWNISYLNKRFPKVKFRQESVKWNLNFYKEYHDNNRDESPLYLFDCQSVAIKELSDEFNVPEIFKFDFFKLFNSNDINTRPDYRWIIIGPKNSGSTFHKDPNSTCAWNANLIGLKLWVMTPPGIKPPGIDTDLSEGEVTAPVGITEWVLSGFYNDSLKLAKQGDCLIGITFPGEVMFVPAGWWHSVINLDDSVAITQNFVPKGNLPKVFEFLKNKNDQISGFHIDEIVKFVKSFINNNENIENIEIFNDFLKKVGELESNEEDIGELKLSINLPIYELFVELIKASDQFKEYLPNALRELEQLEFKNLQKKEKVVVPSKKWENLTENTASTFSFNFDED